MTDSLIQTPQDKAYIKNGILYQEYIGGVAINNILDAEKTSLELIKQQGKNTVPLIIIMKDFDKSPFKIGMADYAKAIRGLGLISHISGIWLIVDSEEAKKGIALVNKTFLGNRMHVVDTLEEAQLAAQALITSTEAILEHE